MDFKQLEAHWFVLCESKDVKQKPRSFKLLNKPVVIYRGPDQKPVAFIDKCPHRNVPLSEGTVCNGHLVCQFHGWEFDERGECVKIPGMVERDVLRAPGVKKFETIERDGLIWVRLDPGATPERQPHFAAHFSDAKMASRRHSTSLKCSMVNIAENFLDPFHTPFVHAGIIRTASDRTLNQITPAHIENGLEVVYIKPKQQSGFISLFGRQVHRDVGRFLMPGIIELEYWADDGLEFVNTMYITPRSETESSIYFLASLRPYILPTALVYGVAGFAIKFALNQDKMILERQTQMAIAHGGEAYANTELDIVRRQLDYLYAGNGRQVDFKPLEALI